MNNIFTLIKSYFWSTLHIMENKTKQTNNKNHHHHQQSLQPDKHHKLSKTGVVALLKPARFTTDFSAVFVFVFWKLKCT